MSHPVRYARKYYVTIPHVFLLFVASPFLVRRRDAWTVAYTVFAGFLVLASGHQTRYLMPIIPLAAAATAAVLAALYVLVKNRWSQWAAAGAVVFIAYVSAYAGFNTLLELRSLWRASARGYFVGRDSALDMLARENSGNGIAGAAEFFRKRFADPPPSGVLMIVENRCFPIAQQCFGDHPTIFGHRWLAELMKAGADYNRLRKNLLRQGIRYILFTRDALPMARDQALQTITQDITLKDRHRRRMIWGLHHLYGFGQEYATIVYRTRRVAIYDIAQKRQSFSHTPRNLNQILRSIGPQYPTLRRADLFSCGVPQPDSAASEDRRSVRLSR
jgi:hypothetical protein